MPATIAPCRSGPPNITGKMEFAAAIVDCVTSMRRCSTFGFGSTAGFDLFGVTEPDGDDGRTGAGGVVTGGSGGAGAGAGEIGIGVPGPDKFSAICSGVAPPVFLFPP
jgi:hypothetical protein